MFNRTNFQKQKFTEEKNEFKPMMVYWTIFKLKFTIENAWESVRLLEISRLANFDRNLIAYKNSRYSCDAIVTSIVIISGLNQLKSDKVSTEAEAQLLWLMWTKYFVHATHWNLISKLIE